MVDTVYAWLPKGEYQVDRKSVPEGREWTMRPGKRGSVTQQLKENDVHFFNHSRHLRITDEPANYLRMQAELPCLIYPSTLHEISEADIDSVNAALVRSMRESGIQWSEKPDDLRIGRIDYCRNLVMTNLAREYVQSVQGCTASRKMPHHFGIETAMWGNKAEQTTCYDKVTAVTEKLKDLKPKERDYNQLSKLILTRPNILRIENRLLSGRAINNRLGSVKWSTMFDSAKRTELLTKKMSEIVSPVLTGEQLSFFGVDELRRAVQVITAQHGKRNLTLRLAATYGARELLAGFGGKDALRRSLVEAEIATRSNSYEMAKEIESLAQYSPQVSDRRSLVREIMDRLAA